MWALTRLGGGVAEAVWENRLLDRAKDKLTFASGRVGVRPLANSLQGSGARVFWLAGPAGADWDLTSTLGTGGASRQEHILEATWRSVRATAFFRRQPKDNFSGLGNDTVPGDRTSFTRREAGAELAYRRALGGGIEWWASAGLEQVDVDDGESGSAPPITARYPALPELRDAVLFVEGQSRLQASWVDVPGSPRRGNRSLARLGYAYALDGGDWSHIDVAFLSEQFFEVLHGRVLEVRLAADWRLAPGKQRVPFYRLASLGGVQVLRGYKEGRFRERGALAAAATYRFPVWDRIDGRLFYERGRVFAGTEDLGLDDWHASYGGGVRAWVEDGVLFGLALGRSDEATRIFFEFKTLF